MKINNEKKIGLPLDPICPQFWGRSSADSPLKKFGT